MLKRTFLDFKDNSNNPILHKFFLDLLFILISFILIKLWTLNRKIGVDVIPVKCYLKGITNLIKLSIYNLALK